MRMLVLTAIIVGLSLASPTGALAKGKDSDDGGARPGKSESAPGHTGEAPGQSKDSGNGPGSNNGNGNSSAGSSPGSSSPSTPPSGPTGNSGNGAGSGTNNGNGPDNNNGNGPGSNNGNGPGNNNGNGGAGSGSTPAPGNGAGAAPAKPASGATPQANAVPAAQSSAGIVALTEDEARDAANAGHTVPLSSVLPDVQNRTGGQIVDAQLVKVRNFLVFAIKVIGADSRVSIQYYYAQSGAYIGSDQ